MNVGCRQIHLDFHNSEHVGEIGADFDPGEFAECLARAAVDHVNLFAKCHHSWSYYPTTIGRVHPGLSFDLFGRQVEACRSRGMVVGAYYTIGWSAGDLERHPEWAALRDDGTPLALNVDSGVGPDEARPAFSWQYLCPTGEYLDHMIQQVIEIANGYAPDGFWFDISAAPPWFCSRCRAGMQAARVRVDDPEAVTEYNLNRWRTAGRALRLAGGVGDGRWAFFNGTTVVHADDRHVGALGSGLANLNSHQDLEHLPTTWGGFDKLPLRARFFQSEGWNVTAMSGRFHTAWGEFGGYKSERALEFEAWSMLANGARCNFGDQLHPSGRLDARTYDLIGTVYNRIASLSREFANGARPWSNLALCPSVSESDDHGLARALLEGHREFVVVQPPDLDPSRHQAVLCAGPPAADSWDAFADFHSRGGNLVLLGDALAGCPRLLLDALGISSAARSERDGDYSHFEDDVDGLGDALYYNYEPGWRMWHAAGCTALGQIHDAMFDRTYGRYCSHQHAPAILAPTVHPVLLRSGGSIVAAHPLGRLYGHHGAEVHRHLLWRIVEHANPEPPIRIVGLPRSARVCVLREDAANRTVVGIVNASIVPRGRAVVVDDVPLVSRTRLELRLPAPVVGVRELLSGADLDVRHAAGAAIVELPPFRMSAFYECMHRP